MVIAWVVVLRQIETETNWPFEVIAGAAVPPVTDPVATISDVPGTVVQAVPPATTFVIAKIVVFLLDDQVTVPPVARATPFGAEADAYVSLSAVGTLHPEMVTVEFSLPTTLVQAKLFGTNGAITVADADVTVVFCGFLALAVAVLVTDRAVTLAEVVV